MKSKLHMRWMVLSGIWLAALGLTGWNLAKVDRVAEARVAIESLRKEIHFQRFNAQQLEQVAARHEALFLHVESLDLGMVTLRYHLSALTAAFHLQDLVIDAEMNQIAEGRIPCRLSLTGEFENTVGFLTALDAYPYLMARQTLIAAAPDAHIIRLEMSLFVQYKIVPPALPAETLPKVTVQPLTPEGRPL